MAIEWLVTGLTGKCESNVIPLFDVRSVISLCFPLTGITQPSVVTCRLRQLFVWKNIKEIKNGEHERCMKVHSPDKARKRAQDGRKQ